MTAQMQRSEPCRSIQSLLETVPAWTLGTDADASHHVAVRATMATSMLQLLGALRRMLRVSRPLHLLKCTLYIFLRKLLGALTPPVLVLSLCLDFTFPFS